MSSIQFYCKIVPTICSVTGITFAPSLKVRAQIFQSDSEEPIGALLILLPELDIHLEQYSMIVVRGIKIIIIWGNIEIGDLRHNSLLEL